MGKFYDLTCIVLWLNFKFFFASTIFSSFKSTEQKGRVDVLDETHEKVLPTTFDVYSLPPPQIAKKGMGYIPQDAFSWIEKNEKPSDTILQCKLSYGNKNPTSPFNLKTCMQSLMSMH